MPLREGRFPIAADNTREPGGVAALVIDERLAAREWPERSAISKRLFLGDLFALDAYPAAYEVVGVVGYVPQGDHRDRRSTVYIGRHLYQSVELGLVLRTERDPLAVMNAARAAVTAVDADMPVDVVRMSDLVEASLAPTRFLLDVLAVFSTVALALAAVGLYSVLAHGVRQRFREIGIRLALGAPPGRVRQRVVRHALALTALGVLIGAVGALFMGHALRSQLFGVQPGDPLALAGTALTVYAVAFVAAWVPARRAAAIDPGIALRQE